MKQMYFILSAIPLAAGLAMAAGDAAAGKAVYEKSCKTCHGADGAHNPGIAKMMKVDMKDLSSSDVQSMSDGDLKKVVADGTGKMKPVAGVSGPALDNAIAYIRTLKK